MRNYIPNSAQKVISLLSFSCGSIITSTIGRSKIVEPMENWFKGKLNTLQLESNDSGRKAHLGRAANQCNKLLKTAIKMPFSHFFSKIPNKYPIISNAFLYTTLQLHLIICFNIFFFVHKKRTQQYKVYSESVVKQNILENGTTTLESKIIYTLEMREQ